MIGESNVADALSRLITKTQIDEPFDEDNDKHLLFALDAGTMDLTWKDIDLESEEHTELGAIRTALVLMKWPKDLHRFEAHVKELRILGPKVFKAERLILPKSLRSKALSTAHRGHIGCAAMKRILREFFWWPGLSDDVESFVRSCRTCKMITKRNPPLPLSSRKLPEGPWEILQIDFLSLPGCGFGEFLIVVDTYSRYLTAVEMKCTDANSTNVALSKIFLTWGLPLVIQSDNGPPFQSNEFIEFWIEKGLNIRKSIPLCPQSNGAVERQNQGLIKAVAGAKQDGENWKVALQDYVHVHNTIKPHSRLGVTPFELLVGWKYRGTFPCLWEQNNGKVDREAIRDRDAESKLISSKYADNHRGAKYSSITAGDRVLLAVPKKTKTDPTFSNEEYTVLSRDGGKVVIRSDRGVQYSRSIRDVKLISDYSEDEESETEQLNVPTEQSECKYRDEDQIAEKKDADIQPGTMDCRHEQQYTTGIYSFTD